MAFQKYDVNEKKKEKKEKKWTKKNKQGRKNYKETTGTKLISNTKKHKLKSWVEFGIADIRCYIKEEEKETEGKKRKKKSHRNYKKKL